MSERMVQVTVRFPSEQLDAVEQLVDEGEFRNQSEAIRAAIRTQLGGDRHQRGGIR